MIFVTVGTHEQNFNRLLKEIDSLVECGIIADEVIVQSGYSDYESKYLKKSSFLGYKDMESLIDDARVVITHGGPATFMSVLAKGKIPIVVPRQKRYDEHVNDHQLEFCKRVSEKYPIVVVEDIKKLRDVLNNEQVNIKLESNNREFNQNLEKLIINNFGKEFYVKDK